MNTTTNKVTNLAIKHGWCAWDSNPGPKDGRRRHIHWAMAAPNFSLTFSRGHSTWKMTSRLIGRFFYEIFLLWGVLAPKSTKNNRTFASLLKSEAVRRNLKISNFDFEYRTSQFEPSWMMCREQSFGPHKLDLLLIAFKSLFLFYPPSFIYYSLFAGLIEINVELERNRMIYIQVTHVSITYTLDSLKSMYSLRGT